MQDQFNLYFAMELIPCGELWHKLMDENKCQVGLFESQARFYAAEIVNGKGEKAASHLFTDLVR